jgi:hypothetical protein
MMREIDYSPLFKVEIKGGWTHTATPHAILENDYKRANFKWLPNFKKSAKLFSARPPYSKMANV